MNLRNDGPAVAIGEVVCRVLAGIFTNADEGGETDQNGDTETCPAKEAVVAHHLEAAE